MPQREQAERDAVGDDALEAGRTIEVVCVGSGLDPIRSRVPPHGVTVMVRTGLSRVRPVPGEIFTLEIERSWVFGHTRHVKGRITGSRLDVARLELRPLGLREEWLWDPEEEAWLFEEADHPVYEEIRSAGPRRQYEMEQVLPDDAVELRWEEDPILEAVELAAAGATHEAADLLGRLLTADLRCLDAHAHLGNLEFRRHWPGALDRAERHYRAGLEIAALTLGDDFRGLLPSGLIDNRPFLRCLGGHGLCRWRKGDLEAAAGAFRRLVWLDPYDRQGARFELAAVEAGQRWDEVDDGKDREAEADSGPREPGGGVPPDPETSP